MSAPEPIIISTASPALAPRLAQIHRLAFDRTAIHRALVPAVSAADQESWRAADLTAYMSPYHVARGRVLLVASLGDAPDEVVGYAVWDEVRPGRTLTREEEAAERPESTALPEGMAVELAGDFFGRMAEMAGRLNGDRYYLAAVAVDPAYQRRGVATALIRWGLARADAAGLPTFLNSTAEGEPTYTQLGFVADAPAVVAKDGSFYSTPMVRPVRTP